MSEFAEHPTIPRHERRFRPSLALPAGVVFVSAPAGLARPGSSRASAHELREERAELLTALRALLLTVPMTDAYMDALRLAAQLAYRERRP